MREALTRVLNAAGFQARPFPSAEALLEDSGAWIAQCLVLDVCLPGLSGFELFRRLGAAGVAFPAIFITAHDDEASRAEARSLGAAGSLSKPFTGRQLVDAISAALPEAPARRPAPFAR